MAYVNHKHNSQTGTTQTNIDIYNIDELGPTTGTVFQIFANNNLDTKINTLFDTGVWKVSCP